MVPISFAVILNMKRKKRSKNFLKSTNTTAVATAVFYLPDECWEHIFKFVISDKPIRHRDRYLSLNSLSLVSKQFLFITDRLRFSLTISTPTVPFLDQLLKRFTNLNYLYLSSFRGDVDALISQIFSFQLNITTLILRTKPANLFLIANCFPNLQQLDLSHFTGLPEEGINHVLRKCCNITHLNLTACKNVKLRGMNFEVPKLETLDLSCSNVDDETLYVISKYCRRLLQLSLLYCNNVTKKGVKYVVENCTQLREINLEGCDKLHSSLVCYSQPALLKARLGKHIDN